MSETPTFDTPQPDTTDNEPTEKIAKDQAEKQNADPELIHKAVAERLAKTEAAEKQDRAEEQTQIDAISQDIDVQPSQEVMTAIGQVEKMYRQFAVRWDAGLQPDMTTADSALEPVCKAYNQLRPGPARTAIEDALNAAFSRATAETPNIQFHASGGESLRIVGSQSNAPTQPASFPHSLQQFMALLQRLFGRQSSASEQRNIPAIDRFNGQSSLGVASTSPGTRAGADPDGQLRPDDLVPGTYNLRIKLRASLTSEQQDRFMGMVVGPVVNTYDLAEGHRQGLLVRSLNPRQIPQVLEAFRRWEQAEAIANQADDPLRGIPLEDRGATLNSYRLLPTDAQRTYFRFVMARVSLERQSPLARLLPRLTARMTQDLATGGPLHEPDISAFLTQLPGMAREEKEAIRYLPIGDRAHALFFPGMPNSRALSALNMPSH